MTKQAPKIFCKHSIKTEVEEGKKYLYCACGHSQNQPFCDGSHSNTGISPILYTATESRLVGFCGCRHSKKGPICDGSHKFLEDN